MKELLTMQVSQENTSQSPVLVQHGQATPIYIDPQGKDFGGLKLVASSVAKDIEMVTGVLPEIVTEKSKLKGTAIVAGTIGNNDIIDSLIAKGRVDISELKKRRESFIIRFVTEPSAELETAIVIIGSEKRGVFYGLYHISKLCGVSPWVYWGDVHPAKQSQLVFTKEQLEYTSKEPSIRYRGFFMNDEWPSLGSWSRDHCGGFNEKMYEKVFELLLRLKANYLWPAMWSAVFSEDGESYPLANAELAHDYGIIMGTSHHEPLFRAGEEWKHINHRYGDNGLWDYWENTEAITRFWEDGVIRNKDLESIITLGMRGEQDSALGGTFEENIQRLKDIIITQKKLLQKHGLEHAPQVLTIYKEVEAFWYGSDEVPGLKDWDVLDDVTIIMSDDNFGNMRKLPDEEARTRKAGWGIYYHFDYHGGPRSYEWVNTVPLEKIWEQMSLAYDYGIRDLWIVNVGDLKPMELPLSYFMELAYDFEAWGTANPNKTTLFLHDWVKMQFGHTVPDDALSGIADVLEKYTRLNGTRKPEITYADTYSVTHYNEGQRVLAEAIKLEEQAEAYYKLTADEHKDAYYQLVYYPAVASANVKKMHVYAGLNQKYYNFQPQSMLANHYAGLVEQAIKRDIELQDFYNNELSNGKWKGMMSSLHIGYVNWNDEGAQFPNAVYIESTQEAPVLIVDVEGNADCYTSGEVELPNFSNLQQENYRITISNGGTQPLQYRLEASHDWIKTSQQQGNIIYGDDIIVSVDWDQVYEDVTGEIIISSGNDSVKVRVQAQVIQVDELPSMTFVGSNGVIVIEAEHTCNRQAGKKAHFEVIEKYGRSLSSMKLFPTTAEFESSEEAPYLEYRFYVGKEGTYTVIVHTAPTNPLTEENRLPYAVGIDGGKPVKADMLPANFAAGESWDWSESVMNNVHTHATEHHLTAGVHTLRFYVLHAAIVLQKLVITKNTLPYSYFGPQESYFKK